MGGLFGAIQVSLQNLSNMQTGLSVVNENVANVNTPGYSRKRIVFAPGPYDQRPFGMLGTGAQIERVESIRDYFLESRIGQEYQAKGFYEGQQFGVSQLETIVGSSDGSGIPDQLSKFFDAFLELASEPSSSSLRQVAMTEGDQLAQTIRGTVDRLDSLDEANRSRIEDSVATVNGVLQRIADINVKLQPILKRGQDGGPLYDERAQLLNQLNEEMSVQVSVDQSYNMIISTTSGRLLLMGSDVTGLSTQKTMDGVSVMHEGTDITSEISSGKMGGLIDFQTSTLASTRTALNSLAAELASAVNAAHHNGVDLDGNPGGDFFTVTAGNEARSIDVALTDFRQLAAGAPGTGIGDGTNAQALADLRDAPIAGLGNEAFGDYYSQIVFDVGMASRGIQANLSLQDKVLQQLENQRESVSGVSLDEEAVNLLQYQRSYQASSKLLRVLDSLLEETLNIVK
ncbi:MAG: flagellar hook-associated protein FlgK [Acidobacteriota bacterium]